MAKTRVITEEMIDAALVVLEKRIAEPPPATMKTYSRRDAFLKLKSRAKDALAAGHSLETVLDDLKGIGIGMTLSTARQYLKPGRVAKRQNAVSSPTSSPVAKPPKPKLKELDPSEARGTFTVTADDKDI